MLTQSRRKPLWRIVKLLALSVLSVLLILAIVGTAWNYLSVYSVREQNPPPGHLYDVDGHAMHLYCTGSGSPTVVLESGHGEAFTVWGKVQPGLSKVTRTCSYDRAGFGWSADQPGERDATHIVDQLHGLLESAGITDPVVLAGHSAGGLYATVYAATFPEEVAAVVLVDATSPSPSPQPPILASLDEHSDAEFFVVKAMVALGVARLAGQCDAVPPGLESYAGWIKADACHYPQLDVYVREDKALGKSRAEAARVKSLGNVPVLVISQDPDTDIPAFLKGRISPEDWNAGLSARVADQVNLLQLSTQSNRVVATHSGHYVQYDRPDVVVDEISSLVGRIRER